MHLEPSAIFNQVIIEDDDIVKEKTATILDARAIQIMKARLYQTSYLYTSNNNTTCIELLWTPGMEFQNGRIGASREEINKAYVYMLQSQHDLLMNMANYAALMIPVDHICLDLGIKIPYAGMTVDTAVDAFKELIQPIVENKFQIRSHGGDVQAAIRFSIGFNIYGYPSDQIPMETDEIVDYLSQCIQYMQDVDFPVYKLGITNNRYMDGVSADGIIKYAERFQLFQNFVKNLFKVKVG